MRNILNIGIIGCGKHVRNFHIPSLLRLKNKYKITGLFDPNYSRAKNLKKKFKIKKLYRSVTNLLNDKDIDVVDICSPPKFHYYQILKSIKKDKHVMVEKPMVLKSADLKEIIKINLKKKKKILCLQQQNFRHETQNLLNFFKMNKKKIGKIKFIHGKAHVPIPDQVNSSFTNKKISGGGPLIDQGSHIIGLVVNIMKYPIISKIKSFIFKRKNSYNKNTIFNVENAAYLEVLFKNQTHFLFETSYNKKKISDFQINFYFKEGSINWPSLKYNFKKKIKIKKIKKVNSKIFASDAQFKHFYDIVKTKKKPITSLTNSLYLVKLIEDSYKKSILIK